MKQWRILSMVHYEQKIDDALSYLKDPSRLSPTGFSPIVYMVYNPEDTMHVRSLTQTVLVPKAEFFGFHVHFLSLGEILDEYINHHPYTEFWVDPTISEDGLFESIRQEIRNDNYIENAIIEAQEKLSDDAKNLMVLTDVDLLHPFNLMGVIENKIYNQVKVPMLVLYPGETQGTARSFIGIYPQDGNYRSINF